jgi:hypothetical protein
VLQAEHTDHGGVHDRLQNAEHHRGHDPARRRLDVATPNPAKQETSKGSPGAIRSEDGTNAALVSVGFSQLASKGVC